MNETSSFSEQAVNADGSKRLRSDSKAPTLHGVKTPQELNLASRPLQTSKPNSSTFNGLAGVPALEGGPWSWYTEEWRNMENVSNVLKFCKDKCERVIVALHNTGIIGGTTPLFDDAIPATGAAGPDVVRAAAAIA